MCKIDNVKIYIYIWYRFVGSYGDFFCLWLYYYSYSRSNSKNKYMNNIM